MEITSFDSLLSFSDYLCYFYFQYKYLFPLADEVPEFVSYFVAYSVVKESLRLPLFKVLNHWLTSRRSSLIMAFIKETPTVAKHFASVVCFFFILPSAEHSSLSLEGFGPSWNDFSGHSQQAIMAPHRDVGVVMVWAVQRYFFQSSNLRIKK